MSDYSVKVHVDTDIMGVQNLANAIAELLDQLVADGQLGKVCGLVSLTGGMRKWHFPGTNPSTLGAAIPQSQATLG